MGYTLSITDSAADYAMAIISAVIATVTYITSTLNPIDPTITTVTILGAITIFLRALIDTKKIVPAKVEPEPVKVTPIDSAAVV